MSTASLGRPVTIIEFQENNNLKLHEDELIKILYHKDVFDRKVVVLSIVGSYRQGKSFLINYFLRYLYAHYPSVESPSRPAKYKSLFANWMMKGDEDLIGFSWTSGTERETSGIVFWSDVFLHELDNGDKLAIILMDTQGLGAMENFAVDPARIFGLSLLISSMQIYNLAGIIQEDQMKLLQLAAEAAQCLSNNSNESFQYLMLLMRDWTFTNDFSYGYEGGHLYLRKTIATQDSYQNPSLAQLRNFILQSFIDLDCFLLPNPGKISSKGNWMGFDREFKNNLNELVSLLFSPGSLIVKKVNGKSIHANELHALICDLMAPPTRNLSIEEKFEHLMLQNLDDAGGVVQNSEPFDCPICFNFVKIEEGIILRDCLHSFCKDCLGETIIHSEDARVKCPYINKDFSCGSILQDREIRASVSEIDLEKHLARGLQLAEALLTTFHCKTPNCIGFCEVDGEVKEFVCQVCWKQNCISCNIIHENLSCDEFKTSNRVAGDEVQTAKALEEQISRGEVMKCPGCQTIVTKITGCDYLMCSVCRMEICWVTKKKRRGIDGCGCQPQKKCDPRCGNCH